MAKARKAALRGLSSHRPIFPAYFLHQQRSFDTRLQRYLNIRKLCALVTALQTLQLQVMTSDFIRVPPGPATTQSLGTKAHISFLPRELVNFISILVVHSFDSIIPPSYQPPISLSQYLFSAFPNPTSLPLTSPVMYISIEDSHCVLEFESSPTESSGRPKKWRPSTQFLTMVPQPLDAILSQRIATSTMR